MRFLKHIALDVIAFWIPAFWGFYLLNDVAANIAIFVIPALSILSLLGGFAMCVTNDEKLLELVKKKSRLHEQYSLLSPLAEVLFLAATGHFVLATLWLFSQLVVRTGTSNALRKQQEQTA